MSGAGNSGPTLVASIDSGADSLNWQATSRVTAVLRGRKPGLNRFTPLAQGIAGLAQFDKITPFYA